MSRLLFFLGAPRIFLMVSGLVFFGACSSHADSYSIFFKSQRGSVLATGQIALAEKLPISGTVQGSYRLVLKGAPPTDKEVDWFFRLFEGKLQGHVDWTLSDKTAMQGLSRFNFMPGTADANIFASAKIDPAGAGQGTWSYAIFAGAWDGGAFEIRKQ